MTALDASDGALFVVHQMAKIASMAWVHAARPAARETSAEPLHTHYLTETNLKAIDAILAGPREDNTIVNALIARTIVRKGRKGIVDIALARSRGQEIRIVTGIRDPVARSLSLLTFFADFCGHAGGALSARDGAEPDQVCAMLGGLWRSVLEGTEPAGSFERLVWRMIGAYRTWFGDELEAVFGLEVFSAPFPWPDGAQRLSGPGIELLAYRAEDMATGAPARAALHDAARTFLGVADFTLPEVNTAATRRSWPLYRQTRERFSLPAASLEAIYDVPAVRHFYRPEEIAAFKSRWAAPSPRRRP